MYIHCAWHCVTNIMLSYKSMFYRFERTSHNHPITVYALFLTLSPLSIFLPYRWFCFYFHVYFMSYIHTYAYPYFTYLDRNHVGDKLAWLGLVTSHCSHLSWVPFNNIHSIWSSLLIGYHAGLNQDLLLSKPNRLLLGTAGLLSPVLLTKRISTVCWGYGKYRPSSPYLNNFLFPRDFLPLHMQLSTTSSSEGVNLGWGDFPTETITSPIFFWGQFPSNPMALWEQGHSLCRCGHSYPWFQGTVEKQQSYLWEPEPWGEERPVRKPTEGPSRQAGCWQEALFDAEVRKRAWEIGHRIKECPISLCIQRSPVNMNWGMV